jgi:UDP-GlcNAc:undecaprenyl-phosphate/decaprenyl-phosphate GlcNAc-1-phosphate transferase
MTSVLLIWGAFAFILSFFGTIFFRYLATNLKIVDKPRSHPKKVHSISIPKLGGNAIFIAVVVCVVGVLMTSDLLTSGEVTQYHYIGLLLGAFVLMLGGFFDDKYELSPKFSFVAPLVAAFIAVMFGVEVEKLTNPFGGVVYLSGLQSDILVFGWLLIVMYTTKFLDGLDGLATSVSGVGAVMVLLLSLTVAYFQPDVALLAAIVIGAELGFLFWNFHPASIFLGEGGSTLVGFLLGTLAVISGGKLATALLVLGVPFLDVIWVVLRRFKKGGLKQIVKGDRKHLHHRLLKLGLSQKQVVFLYVFVSAGFGVLTIFLQSREKLVALILLLIMMFIAALFFVKKEKQYE